ncbi:MAG: hypothetical protein PHP89_06535, partial [Candidatus Omnitrophica bacterium]|nr:hypothetical protein [Candidatus Omnitrophota bacterium]
QSGDQPSRGDILNLGVSLTSIPYNSLYSYSFNNWLSGGLVLGGRYGNIANIANITYSLSRNSSPLGWIGLVDQSAKLISQLDAENEALRLHGGILRVRDRQWNLVIGTVGAPEATVNAEYNQDGTLKNASYTGSILKVETLVETIQKFFRFDRWWQGDNPLREYPAIVILGEHQIRSFEQVLSNTDPDVTFVAYRRGENLYVLRINLSENRAEDITIMPLPENTEVLSESRMFTRDTQEFLKRVRRWMSNESITLLPSASRLTYAQQYIWSCQNSLFGAEIDPLTGEVYIYQDVSELRALVLNKYGIPVNPHTGRVFIPSIASSIRSWAMNEGLSGEYMFRVFESESSRRIRISYNAEDSLPRAGEVMVYEGEIMIPRAIAYSTHAGYGSRFVDPFELENLDILSDERVIDFIDSEGVVSSQLSLEPPTVLNWRIDPQGNRYAEIVDFAREAGTAPVSIRSAAEALRIPAVGVIETSRGQRVEESLQPNGSVKEQEERLMGLRAGLQYRQEAYWREVVDLFYTTEASLALNKLYEEVARSSVSFENMRRYADNLYSMERMRQQAEFDLGRAREFALSQLQEAESNLREAERLYRDNPYDPSLEESYRGALDRRQTLQSRYDSLDAVNMDWENNPQAAAWAWHEFSLRTLDARIEDNDTAGTEDARAYLEWRNQVARASIETTVYLNGANSAAIANMRRINAAQFDLLAAKRVINSRVDSIRRKGVELTDFASGSQLGAVYVLSEEQLAQVASTSDRRLESLTILDDQAMGNVFWTRDFMRASGFNIDLGAWGMQELNSEGKSVWSSSGPFLLLRREGQNWVFVSKTEFVERYRREQLTQDTDNYRDAREYRIVFLNSLGLNPSSNLYLGYTGGFDFNLDGNGNMNNVHSIDMKREVARGFFVDANAGYADARRSGPDDLSWTENGVVHLQPTGIEGRNTVSQAEVGVGRSIRNRKNGDQARIFMRWLEDDSQQFGYNRLLPGASLRYTLFDWLQASGEITPDTYGSALNINLPRGMHVALQHNHTIYDKEVFSLNFTLPVNRSGMNLSARAQLVNPDGRVGAELRLGNIFSLRERRKIEVPDHIHPEGEEDIIETVTARLSSAMVKPARDVIYPEAPVAFRNSSMVISRGGIASAASYQVSYSDDYLERFVRMREEAQGNLLGVKYYVDGRSAEALSASDYARMVTLRGLMDSLSDEQLNRKGIFREGSYLYTEVRNGSETIRVYLNVGIDASGRFVVNGAALDTLVLPLEDTFAVIGLEEAGVRRGLADAEGFGALSSISTGPSAEVRVINRSLSMSDIEKIISGGHLYGVRNSNGDVVLRARGYDGIEDAVLNLGARGERALRDIENRSFARLVERTTGRIAFITNQSDMPLTRKMYLEQANTDTGFSLRPATAEEISFGENIVDAVTTEGSIYLVDYNPRLARLGPRIEMYSEVTVIDVS